MNTFDEDFIDVLLINKFVEPAVIVALPIFELEVLFFDYCTNANIDDYTILNILNFLSNKVDF